jgi:hypothetical protein
MAWTGGAANRTWKRGRIDTNRNVAGDRARGQRLAAELAAEMFWCERCGGLHELRQMSGCDDYGYANRR